METTNDIVREIREFADTESQSIGRDVLCRSIQHFADRIEKAHEFELAVEKAKAAGEGYAAGKQSVTDCNQLGNAAKMREALEEISNLADAIYTNNECANENSLAILSMCEVAISAPARNCDLYSKDEVRLAYHLHGDGLMTMQAFADWLFAEAKGE